MPDDESNDASWISTLRRVIARSALATLASTDGCLRG
jgi:hypothetical protein